jgi:hypothetical protein
LQLKNPAQYVYLLRRSQYLWSRKGARKPPYFKELEDGKGGKKEEERNREEDRGGGGSVL